MSSITLTDSEHKYYNDLFNLCDVEKVGKITKLKAEEFLRTAKNIDNDILTEINQIAGVIPSFLYLNRTQFFSCLRLIGAYQSKIMPLRKEILTTSTIQIPLPKFSWNFDLEPPIGVILDDHPSTSTNDLNQHTQNGPSSTNKLHSPDLIELESTKKSSTGYHVDISRNINSDIPSTDSEMEQTDNEREAGDRSKRLGVNTLSSNKQSGKSKRTLGSPNWSTASDSPTPTNSTHNSVELSRPWASNSQSWQGLLCEEQRQLLGTEEESSDKHSSDEDEDDLDLEALYQITSEQKEYYLKQFRTIQPDIGGLLSGVVAKVFFEKSRIPVEELRHIWQLCDVTKDGALDVAEFTAAMHLVVLRRNNIPIPSILPSCLQPKILYKTLGLPQKDPVTSSNPEVDLLNLESDDNQDTSHRNTMRTNAVNKNEYQRMISSTYDEYRSIPSGKSTIINKSSTLPKNHFSSHRGEGDGASAVKDAPNNMSISSSTSSNNNNNVNNLNLNLYSNNSKQMNINKNVINRSGSNSPLHQVDGVNANDGSNASKEWTKFTESPTSNVSSPGPKPVNVTQAIVSDQHVIHPVPLRMTPISSSDVTTNAADEEALRTFRKADSLVYESGVVKSSGFDRDDASPKNHQYNKNKSHYGHHQRDSLPNDLRAIQRPHPKKPVSKNIGQIPMPPLETNNQVTISGGTSIVVSNKKEIPPLPPPRPHRHTRSSSLDLQRIKLSNNNISQDNNNLPSQPPEIPPPRISDKSFKMPSVDTYVDSSSTKRNEESFADFTQFPNASSKNQEQKSGEYVTTIRLDNPPIPQPRLQTNSLIGASTNGSQRTSAFEVYRKPSKSRSSQSPAQNEAKIQEYEKQVHVISENLKQVKFPRNANDQNSQELLKYLKEQNSLLIRLCNDLSDELLGIQKRKEDIKGKLDSHQK